MFGDVKYVESIYSPPITLLFHNVIVINQKKITVDCQDGVVRYAAQVYLPIHSVAHVKGGVSVR